MGGSKLLASIDENSDKKQSEKLNLRGFMQPRPSMLKKLDFGFSNSQDRLRETAKSKSSSTFFGFRNFNYNANVKNRYSFNPTTSEIVAVETTEEFNDFYKRIKPKHVDTINIEKEMGEYVA